MLISDSWQGYCKDIGHAVLIKNYFYSTFLLRRFLEYFKNLVSVSWESYTISLVRTIRLECTIPFACRWSATNLQWCAAAVQNHTASLQKLHFVGQKA